MFMFPSEVVLYCDLSTSVNFPDFECKGIKKRIMIFSSKYMYMKIGHELLFISSG